MLQGRNLFVSQEGDIIQQCCCRIGLLRARSLPHFWVMPLSVLRQKFQFFFVFDSVDGFSTPAIGRGPLLDETKFSAGNLNFKFEGWG